MFEVSVSAAMEAAHAMPHEAGPEGYRRLHGHSFLVTVWAGAPTPDPETGWVIDLGDLQTALDAVVGALDHRLLNEVEGLETPTMENILAWVDGGLLARGVRASRLEIARPTLGQRAVYTPDPARSAPAGAVA